MDAKDQQIIRALQQDGRLTNADLAGRVNLSPSPCLRRLRNLEAAGLITGYGAQVDQKAYGLPITAFVRIRLERHNQEAAQTFEAHIARFDAVLECHLMTGDCDYLLRVVAESLEAYETFVRGCLQSIPMMGSIETSFAYGAIKHSRRFPALPR